ncbi:hypothetical protein PLICRDRAFT_180395 [Plicaturopsis crispa FD-325 SS-3]|uniref:Uncharacterized protein n=1 Tax=Plicaturopsis crispa FD-325 SS-3 TaxID=944288 RepID=A0A0C9SKC4_PLICR|nr:hypothetical protein PLICRDRAFT_180395 [Plicaturopsis crispa FD-325 SS-3]
MAGGSDAWFLEDYYATREKAIPAGARPAKAKRARRTSKTQPAAASSSASGPRTRGRAAKDTPSAKSLGKRRVREPSVDVQDEDGPSLVRDEADASSAPAAKKVRLTLRTPRSPSPQAEQAAPSPSDEAIFGSLDAEYAEELQALQRLRTENADLHTENDRLRVGARQLRQTNRDLQAQVESLTAKWVDSEKARRAAETAAAPSQARATELQQRLTASQLTLAASQDRVGQLDRDLRVTKEALAAKSLAYDNQAAGNASLESENIQRTDEFVQAAATLRAQLAEARAELLSAQAALLTSVPRQKYDAAEREVAQLRSVAQASLRVVLTPRPPVSEVGVQASSEPSSSGAPPASPSRASSAVSDYAALLARFEVVRDDARTAQELLRQQRADSSAFRVQSVREMRELLDRVVGLEEQFAAVERERDVLQDELAQRHEVAELVRGLPPAPSLDRGDVVDVEVHRMPGVLVEVL